MNTTVEHKSIKEYSGSHPYWHNLLGQMEKTDTHYRQEKNDSNQSRLPWDTAQTFQVVHQLPNEWEVC